jgi:hypothetical protein
MDYCLPRNKLIETLGASILEVLNGERPPTLAERIRFVISELPSPFFTHTLDSASLTSYERTSVWKAEWRTDALAIEILAPFREVVKRASQKGKEESNTYYFKKAAESLVNEFGIPASISVAYAQHIANYISGNRPLIKEWSIF